MSALARVVHDREGAAGHKHNGGKDNEDGGFHCDLATAGPPTPLIAQINRASHERTVNGPHVPRYRSVCSCEQWNWSYAQWDLAHTCSYTVR